MEWEDLLTRQILVSWVTVVAFNFDPSWNLDQMDSDLSYVCMTIGKEIVFWLVDFYSISLQLLFFQISIVSNIREPNRV